jgi:DNA-binding transcriptional LysR family regulator
MELKQLRHFVALADTLSFRRAAEATGISQQGLSKSLSQLEAQVGVQLADRSRTSVALTEQGDQLLPYARTILAEAQRMDDVLADMTGRKFGQLKIGAAPALLDDIVPATLLQYQALHPRTRIAVVSGDFKTLRNSLVEGELDIVLATAPDEAQGRLINLDLVSSDRNAVVVRAGHPLANKVAITHAELRRFPYRAVPFYGKGESYLKNLFAGSERPIPRAALTTTSVAFATSWVEASDHWWITPKRQISRSLREGALVELDVSVQDGGWPLAIATRRHATTSPAVHTFTTLLKEYVQGNS